jgi:serine/threonine protein phosphatase PrpC
MEEQKVVRCPECREVIRAEDLYCEACGAPISKTRGRAAGARPSANGPANRAPEADEREHVEMAFEDMAGISDRGLRRARNEDAMALARIDSRAARVMVICDGVSTSARPAQAAQAAAEATLRHLVASLGLGHSNLEQAMKEAVTVAQSAVCRVPYERDGHAGEGVPGEAPADDQGPPATTLVAALLMDGRVTLGWVGDSRAYFIGRGEAWQLSHDDTWLEEVIQPHLVGEGAAAVALRAHVLTRWLGSDQEGEPEVSITTFLLPAEGFLLLCSDGLWNYAPTPSQIRDLVAGLGADPTPLQLTGGLIEFARASGGADNVTVALATV